MNNNLTAGYKRTDIGIIPEDWEVKRLGDIGDSIIGLTYTPEDVTNDGLLVHRASNILNNKLTYDDNVYVNKKIKSRLILKENDILICVRNGSRDLIGKSALIKGQSVGETFGAFMSVYRSEEYQPFIFYLVISNIVQTQINQSLGATINQITNKTLNDFLIPYPEKKEERKHIGQQLLETDDFISKLVQLIEKKRNIKQGAMQELLTGKRRLPGFSGKWEEKKIGELLKVKHGKSQKTVASENGIYPILATGGQIGWANKYLYDKPSVLIGRKGTIDKPRYMDTRFWTVDTLFYTEVFNNAVAKYLYYRFCLIDWLRYNEASGVPSLNASTIENIEILFPKDTKEQQEITTILSDMDEDIQTLEACLNKYKRLKQGMMQQLLTGKVRLN